MEARILPVTPNITVMRVILITLLLGLALANTDTTTANTEITLEGHAPSDESSWLDDCTAAVRDSGCSACECTTLTSEGEEVVVTVTGEEQELDKLDDHVEENGIAISGEDYLYVAEEEEEDGTMTLVVTMSLFFLMCICIVGFFACNEWPNTPEKIAAREKARREEEKAKKAQSQVTTGRSGSRY